MASTKVDKNTFNWHQTVSNAEQLERSDNLGENGTVIGGIDGLFLNLSNEYFDRIRGYIVATSWGHSSSGGTNWDSVTEVDTSFERA